MQAGGHESYLRRQSANLIPTAPMRARALTAIFGTRPRACRAASLGAVKFERDDPLYVSTLRTTRCDASGSFSFPRVPDGIWYVTSSVKVAGRLAGRGRLANAAGRRPRRTTGEGVAP